MAANRGIRARYSARKSWIFAASLDWIRGQPTRWQAVKAPHREFTKQPTAEKAGNSNTQATEKKSSWMRSCAFRGTGASRWAILSMGNFCCFRPVTGRLGANYRVTTCQSQRQQKALLRRAE